MRLPWGRGEGLVETMKVHNDGSPSAQPISTTVRPTKSHSSADTSLADLARRDGVLGEPQDGSRVVGLASLGGSKEVEWIRAVVDTEDDGRDGLRLVDVECPIPADDEVLPTWE
jgi:hypothetical protein